MQQSPGPHLATPHHTLDWPAAVRLCSNTGVVRPATIDPKAAVAYLRRLPGADRHAVRQMITALVGFASQQGFGLAGVYYERRPSQRLATWGELITTCRSEGVAHVLVPGPKHFHHDPHIAAFMREELGAKIRGTVWYTTEGTTTATEAGRGDR